MVSVRSLEPLVGRFQTLIPRTLILPVEVPKAPLISETLRLAVPDVAVKLHLARLLIQTYLDSGAAVGFDPIEVIVKVGLISVLMLSIRVLKARVFVERFRGCGLFIFIASCGARSHVGTSL